MMSRIQLALNVSDVDAAPSTEACCSKHETAA
jgi:hypothetical protein